jgi:hypothetical protein
MRLMELGSGDRWLLMKGLWWPWWGFGVELGMEMCEEL